jgi:hypothetical protein
LATNNKTFALAACTVIATIWAAQVAWPAPRILVYSQPTIIEAPFMRDAALRSRHI